MKFLPLIVLAVIPSLVTANCLPENNLRIPSFIEGTGISQADYLDAIQQVENEFSKDFKDIGFELEILRAWDAPEVEADALDRGRTLYVRVKGGFARLPRITKDGLLLSLCHEVGHFVGGAPQALFYHGKTVEGQADYFATLKCLRRIFAHDDNEKFLNSESEFRTECEGSFQNRADVAVCVRSAAASAVMGAVSAELLGMEIPSFSTPDQKRVERLFWGHLFPQCRLDTYMAGVLCSVQASLPVSPLDLDVGTCSRWLGHKRGVRPLCWYNEKMNFTYHEDLKTVFPWKYRTH
jgi:hypothetical protein